MHSQTTPAHNMLVYLIWLFNYKPLADCRKLLAPGCSAASCLLSESFVKKPPHVASLAEPRATREIPGPSSRLLSFPRSHGRFCVGAACGDGEGELGQWVSDSMH